MAACSIVALDLETGTSAPVMGAALVSKQEKKDYTSLLFRVMVSIYIRDR